MLTANVATVRLFRYPSSKRRKRRPRPQQSCRKASRRFLRDSPVVATTCFHRLSRFHIDKNPILVLLLRLFRINLMPWCCCERYVGGCGPLLTLCDPPRAPACVYNFVIRRNIQNPQLLRIHIFLCAQRLLSFLWGVVSLPLPPGRREKVEQESNAKHAAFTEAREETAAQSKACAAVFVALLSSFYNKQQRFLFCYEHLHLCLPNHHPATLDSWIVFCDLA